MIFAAAGVNLVADVLGDPTGVPIIFAHGGGQTRAAWSEAAQAMAARGLYAISIDLRGHGESDRAPDADYRLERFADDLAAVVAQLSQPPFIVGASLGGLTALYAIGGPRRISARGLVLVDVAPHVEDDGNAHVIGFMRAAPDGFESLEAAGAAVAAYLPHRPPPKNLDGLRRNLREHADGRLRWHWDPRFVDGPNPAAVSARRADLEAAARNLAIPTLLLRGELSRVLSVAGVAEFRALAPHAEFLQISRADHMIAGDQNDAFAAAIIAFVDRHL